MVKNSPIQSRPHGDAPGGTYAVELEAGGQRAVFRLTVIPAALPAQRLCFTQWFHADCIASLHKVEIYSPAHWALIEKSVQACRRLHDDGIPISFSVNVDPSTLAHPQFMEQIDACLERLPSNTARVFMMREFLGFETDEICKELALSASNCWVILHRARMALRLCLESQWFQGKT